MKPQVSWLIVGILFVATLIFISSIYHFFTNPIRILEIPTPSGKNITLKITGEDVIRIFKSSTKKIQINITERNPKLDEAVLKLNQIISRHKKEYVFYYDEIQKLYPERYFIICTPEGCGYYYFTVAGLVRANYSEQRIKNPLIIYFDDNTFEELVDLLNESDQAVIERFKEYLVDGKIRVKNFRLIAERIVERYEKH
jgi:hypothetical protein